MAVAATSRPAAAATVFACTISGGLLALPAVFSKVALGPALATYVARQTGQRTRWRFGAMAGRIFLPLAKAELEQRGCGCTELHLVKWGARSEFSSGAFAPRWILFGEGDA